MRFAISFILIIFVGRAGAETFTYQDSLGQTWNRHILTEASRDHRKLLLVIDEPTDHRELQRTVLRKSFLPTEKAALAAAQNIARLPHLHPELSTPQALTTTTNPIWPIDHQWTDNDEADYANWIAKNATETFLQGGGVDVDCADYAITLRWIYAHDHHLPAGQQLAVTGTLFGSWESTAAWDALATNADWKQDERFKAELRYILTSTYTHSLFNDLYPVAITPDYVKPSTIYLTLTDGSGHTRTLTTVGSNPNCDDTGGCMIIIWGNEPATEQGFVTGFVPTKLAATEGGFLRFRWPELSPTGWQLRPAVNMPGYSVEQYAWGDDVYLNNISARLSLWTSPDARYQVTGQNVINLLDQRVDAVNNGYFLCSLVPCTPQDPNYADWSTPVRDHAIVNAIKIYQTAAAQVDPSSETVSSFTQANGIPVFDGSPFTYMDILNGQLSASFSPDPRQDFAIRWGTPTMTHDNRLETLKQIIFSLWSSRHDSVTEAQALCFPQGGTTPTCKSDDAKVLSLSTARLDQAFRAARGVFLAEFKLATADEQQQMREDLLSLTTGESYCSDDGMETCSLDDYIFGTVDHWAKMTSNADAPLASRFGF